jgi:hypothetical protein
MCSKDVLYRPGVIHNGFKARSLSIRTNIRRVLIDRNDLRKVKCCLQMTKYVSSTRPIGIEIHVEVGLAYLPLRLTKSVTAE